VEPVQKIDYEILIKEMSPGIERTKPVTACKDYHCSLCNCPIDQWESYRDYPSDRSCELFYFLEDLLAEGKGERFTVDGFVKRHENEVKQEFQDLTNLASVFKQHVEQQLDIGAIEEVSPDIYAHFFRS